MPFRLVLIRHARAAVSAGPDLLRPLTDEGVAQARRQGERLLALAPGGPVLSSPARRCLETASEICAALSRSDDIGVRPELGEFVTSTGMQALLREVDRGGLLVGHQPSLGDLACNLLRRASLPFSFRPATAAVFERSGDEAWSLATVLAAE